MKTQIIIFMVLLTMLSLINAEDIGIAWYGKSGMAVRVTKGFNEAIKELAPNINIETHEALASEQELADLIKKWETNKDGMVILRSNGAKYLSSNPPSIPTFIGACSNPKYLGTVKNLESPEGNITGVTYFLPTDTQFDAFQAIIPNLESVLLIVEKDHPGSQIDVEETKQVCSKRNIKYNEVYCKTKEDAVKAAKENSGKVSLIILGAQALVLDNAGTVIEAAGNTPVVSYASKPVEKDGALGGFVADDVKLGKLLAESVAEVIKSKKSIKDIPVKVDPNPKFYVNVKTAEKLNLSIPYEILESAVIVE